jgi:dipeptidyl aminopeptidase/acylaminoacyl peptidase
MKGGATKAWQLIFDGECRNMSGRVRASCWGAANGASVKVKAMRVAVLAATVAAMCLYASATTAQEKKAKPAQDAKAKSPAAASEQKKAPKKDQKAESKPAPGAAVEAMFGLRTFLQAEISPDGKRVAWVESLPGPNGAPSSNSAIYVADPATPAAKKRITAGDGKAPHEEHDIAWSSDSKQLAFLSDAPKAGQLQLFVIQVSSAPAAEPAATRHSTARLASPQARAARAQATGGAAKQLTHVTGFLASPGWSPDSKTIALLFTENATRAAGPLVAETPDEGVVSEAFLEQRLTLVDAATGKLNQISTADRYVYEFDWSPDGRQLAITAAHGNGDDNWYIAGLYTIDAASGAMHDVQPKPGMQIANPRWSPDGKRILFIGGLMSDEPIPGGDVFSTAADGGAIRNLTPDSKSTATSVAWLPKSEGILITGIAAGETFVERLGPDRSTTLHWRGAETLARAGFVPYVSVASDGKTTAVVRESFSNAPEVWAGPIGDWKQITQVNANLKPAWGEAKSLRWTTSIGSVQGWLIYPADFDPTKKYPLVVYVHGGPAWAITPTFPDRWHYPFALPSHGYFVFEPNPRGSYGMGEKFTRANVKDFGYGDFLDIMAGVDKAIEEAPVDPKRLGITGWSYGGFMTMWAVTQTDRFGAAVAGAGLANYLSYYGQNKIDQWMLPYFGATVYDDPAVYAKSSPINYIKKAKTPTLIVVGDRDGECPAPQSYEFWHALKTLGVPTEFIIYPNEGHLFANPEHSRDVIDRTVMWFGTYLGGAPK